MKKIIFILAVLLLTVPAWAGVSISCTTDGNQVTVSYNSSSMDPNRVRAFAINVSVNNGAKITQITDYKTGQRTAASRGHGIFPGRIVIDGNNGNVISWGNPTARANEPDNPGQIGSPSIVVELGSLYYGDVNKPANSGTLFKFRVDKTCTVTLSENNLRGGVVMEKSYVAANPTFGTCNVGPACWAFPCFSRGDGNGDCVIAPADVLILRAAWPGLGGVYDPCADFDQSGLITPNDILILRANWPGLGGPGCAGVVGCP